jgi:hypothetical protein
VDKPVERKGVREVANHDEWKHGILLSVVEIAMLVQM